MKADKKYLQDIDNLKTRMDVLGVSFNELANEIGVYTSTLTRNFNGGSEMSYRTYLRIKEVLANKKRNVKNN